MIISKVPKVYKSVLYKCAIHKNTTTALNERLWCKISPRANKSVRGYPPIKSSPGFGSVNILAQRIELGSILSASVVGC